MEAHSVHPPPSMVMSQYALYGAAPPEPSGSIVYILSVAPGFAFFIARHEGGAISVTGRQTGSPAPQRLDPKTHISPLVCPKLMRIELVFIPEVIEDPDGTDHVYPVAPSIAAMEYS